LGLIIWMCDFSDFGILVWNLLPFTRGTVKITVSSILPFSPLHVLTTLQSTNPFTPPQTKVNYFSVDFDMQVQIASARLARKVLTTSPMKYVYFLPSVSFLPSPLPFRNAG
jgi:hypothetical protein